MSTLPDQVTVLVVQRDEEHGDLVRQRAHSASGGSAAESSQ